MSVNIKICGITRPEDAEMLVRLGVDALGLMFYEPSPRYVDQDTARDLSRFVEGEVVRVGVFADAPAVTVREGVECVGLDVLQFQGSEEPAFCASFGLPYIRAHRVSGTVDHEALEKRYSQALAIQLDASVAGGLPGGTGNRFDWEQWPARPGLNYVLAGGLTPENVRGAVQRLRPWGVDVSTGVESRMKGIKDADKMRRFVNEVRRAEIG